MGVQHVGGVNEDIAGEGGDGHKEGNCSEEECHYGVVNATLLQAVELLLPYPHDFLGKGVFPGIELQHLGETYV